MSDDLSIPSPTYRVSRHRRAAMDPALQRLLMYAGGLVGVVLLIGGISLLFNRHSGPVPVIQADSRPMRVKPENPGGMQIPGIGNDTTADASAPGKLAPPPEVPDPKALRTPPAAPTLPAPVAVAPGAPVAGATGSESGAAPAAPLARTMPSTPAQTTAPPAAATTTKSALAMAGTAKPLPAPTPVQPVIKAAVTGKFASVQLAALSSEDAARQEWQRMQHRMPDLLGGRSPVISKVDVNGKPFWRLRVAGFGDVAQAKSFCDHVRAKSTSCTVADF